MEKETKNVCPYCMSENTTETDSRRMCNDCGMMFDEEDRERESLRHRMSVLLTETDEDNPKMLRNRVPLEHIEENCGLSSNDCLEAVGVFEFYDGTIWIDVYGSDEPIDFDDLDLKDLYSVFNELF